jgi:hypothetical protein
MIIINLKVSVISSQYIGLEVSQVSPDPLATLVVFNYFSTTAWELQTAVLKPHTWLF